MPIYFLVLEIGIYVIKKFKKAAVQANLRKIFHLFQFNILIRIICLAVHNMEKQYIIWKSFLPKYI